MVVDLELRESVMGVQGGWNSPGNCQPNPDIYEALGIGDGKGLLHDKGG